MAGFAGLVRELKHAERQLLKQLEGIRSAIASLEFGSAVSPGMPDPPAPAPGRSKKRRALSAKARAAISAAQKARWAKQKAGK